MPMTESQRDHVRAELARVAPQLVRAAPVEQERLIRIALERAGVVLTWEEWDACAPDLLGQPLREAPAEQGGW
jgi:hypothetical protein